MTTGTSDSFRFVLPPDRPAARGQPAPGGDEGSQLTCEADGFAIRGLRRPVGRIRIPVPQHGRERPQGVHAVHARERSHGAENRLGQDARRGERGPHVAKLGPGRQPAMPEQIADFFEGRALLGVREIVNVVAVIRENASRAVEIANRRVAGDNVL